MRDPNVHIIIDGQEANCTNIREIGFVTRFTRDVRLDNSRQAELNVDSLILVNESRDQILTWIAINGLFVGIPCEVRYDSAVYQFYIDLADGMIIKDKSILVKIKKRKGLDNFFDLADGLTYESLNAKGFTFPTFNVPCVIVPPNQVELGITLSLAIFSMSQALIQAIKNVQDTSADFIAALDLSPAHAVAAGIKAAAAIAYAAALVFVLIDLARRFRELIFPKIRFYKACKFKDLIVTACNAIGFEFESSLLDSLPGLTFLGVPLQKDNKSIFKFIQDSLTQSFTKGYPTASDTISTLSLTLNSLEKWFNGRVRVVNNKVRLEQRSYYQLLSSISLQTGYNDQENLQNMFRYNTEDAWVRYYPHYMIDESDIHTKDNFEPTDAEYGAQNNVITDPELNMLKGLRNVDIPFSLGTRKSEFNFVENLALEFFTIIDSLTGMDSAALIENRLGVLQISQQFYSNSKVLYVDSNGRQPADYLDTLRASKIFQTYHITEKIENNGFEIYDKAPVNLNFDQYNSLLEVNFADINGTESEIYEMLHMPFDSYAEITYAKPSDYATGKITTFTINA